MGHDRSNHIHIYWRDSSYGGTGYQDRSVIFDDVEEIDLANGNYGYWDLRNRLSQGMRDPLVVDLDGNGVSLVAEDRADVHFDINADGAAEGVSWISSGDGFLAYDRNGNDRIDDGSELFSEYFAPGAHDGWSALATLDLDGDARFDANDAAFGAVLVWRDANGDGVSQASELQTLSAVGISAIDLRATAAEEVQAGGSIVSTGTAERADGSTVGIADVTLISQEALAAALRPADEPAVRVAANSITAMVGDPPSIGDMVANPVVASAGSPEEPTSSTTAETARTADGVVRLSTLTDAAVRVDMDGNGTAEAVTWAGSGDGLLAYDGDGRIDDGSELFSEFFASGALDGWAALARLDSNGDVRFDTADAAFGHVSVWQDGNADGVTDAGERRSLTEAGLAAVDLHATPVGTELPGGTIVSAGTAKRADGSAVTVADVTLTVREELATVVSEHHDGNDDRTPAEPATPVPTVTAPPTADADTPFDAEPPAGTSQPVEVTATVQPTVSDPDADEDPSPDCEPAGTNDEDDVHAQLAQLTSAMASFPDASDAPLPEDEPTPIIVLFPPADTNDDTPLVEPLPKVA